MKNFCALTSIVFFSCLLAGCFGPSEPPEADMKAAFSRAVTNEIEQANADAARAVTWLSGNPRYSSSTSASATIQEFRKHSCKQSPEKPGYICDFTVAMEIKGTLLPSSGGRHNVTGRFFVDRDGTLLFSPS
jgi:hypothetical protein